MVWRPCHMNKKTVLFPFVPPLVVLCSCTHLNRALNDRLFSRKYSIFNILVHQDQIIVTDEWWWQEVELFKIRRVIYALLVFKLVCIFILRLLLISTRCTHILRLWVQVAQLEAANTNQFSKRCIFWDYFYVRKMHLVWDLYTSGQGA